MHTYVKLLEKVSHQYSQSRQLSFGIGHIFKALQLAKFNGHISRDLLENKLSLGGGSIKTLVKHLKTTGMIKTSNAGTILTEKGEKLISQILLQIPKETVLPESSITVGKFNYVVLVKDIANSIHSGIEQRDIAIKSGAAGATTLIFKENKFLIPGTNYNALENELNIHNILVENLQPENNDVIIIGSDNVSKQNAELAAKHAALFTIRNHLKH
ncbi:MAG: DUF4443 domain-containing protein [Nitrososphaeraceae archaeon]|jgi:predicted transcriptional regulator